jgi:lipid-A-disaccharide synthase-like uncharacterized protein
VFIVGQTAGFLVYVRNLMLVRRNTGDTQLNLSV